MEGVLSEDGNDTETRLMERDRDRAEDERKGTSKIQDQEGTGDDSGEFSNQPPSIDVRHPDPATDADGQLMRTHPYVPLLRLRPLERPLGLRNNKPVLKDHSRNVNISLRAKRKKSEKIVCKGNPITDPSTV